MWRLLRGAWLSRNTLLQSLWLINIFVYNLCLVQLFPTVEYHDGVGPSASLCPSHVLRLNRLLPLPLSLHSSASFSVSLSVWSAEVIQLLTGHRTTKELMGVRRPVRSSCPFVRSSCPFVLLPVRRPVRSSCPFVR